MVRSCQRAKKIWKVKVTLIPIADDVQETVSKRLENETGRIEDQMEDRDYINHRIVKNG